MKKIGVGYENYKRIIDDGCYYVDKTMLAEDIIRKGGMVTLFTRPRRFGKTLALSMLRTFFEREYDNEGQLVDNSRYFVGKKIMASGDEILSKMSKYPVINLSLKSAKQSDFETSFLKLRDEIAGEFARHSYIKKYLGEDSRKIAEYESFEYGVSEWTQNEKSFKTKEEREEALRREIGKYSTSLKTLSVFLTQALGQKVIILIDEYDVPLENAFQLGFYNEMIGFMRSLFESALKTNDALEFAAVTGCLRISKESIFTGLNNLKVNSILSGDFSEGFGFNENEVKELLGEYDLSDKMAEVKDWYDGYLFGDSEVYNPWSVIGYVDSVVNGGMEFPTAQWSNTSSNSIIRSMVENADDNVRTELDSLIMGGSIEKRIHEDITYDDINANKENLWNFLYFTGYLKKESVRQENDITILTMKIPNKEIGSIYKTQIKEWFDAKLEKVDFSRLYDAIVGKDSETIAEFLRELLSKSISVFDSDEAFYHGFFLSLLYQMPGYTVKSNREEGNGRPDIILYPERPEDPAYIFELKNRKKFSEMADGLDEAKKQIIDQQYVEGILDDGYNGAISYGICFCKKSCIVGLA